MKKLFFILALLATCHWPLATSANGQAVIVSASGACTGNQAPIFNASTNLFECGNVTSTGAATIGTGLLTGGGVVWTGNLNFSVSPATYLIGGVQFSSALSSITLDPASGANPRIDIIAVDDTGTVVKITGTAATPPAAPSVDPTSQIALTFVYVDTSSTTPTNFSNVDLYLENTEWTCAASAHFNCASTTNPYAGAKDIEATTAVKTNNVTLVKPAAATENLANYNNLVFYIRSKAAWPNPKSVLFYWLNGTTQVGSAVTFKDATFTFSSSQTASYQQITIPVSLFTTGQDLVTTLEMQVAGGGAAIGFYIDNVKLQGGANGGSASVVQFANNIIPTGNINSINQSFVLPQVPNPVTSLECAGNGLRLRPTADYTFNATTATITTVGTFQTGDVGLVCSYRY